MKKVAFLANATQEMILARNANIYSKIKRLQEQYFTLSECSTSKWTKERLNSIDEQITKLVGQLVEVA